MEGDLRSPFILLVRNSVVIELSDLRLRVAAC